MYELYNNYNEKLSSIEWNIGIYLRLSREDEKDEFKKQSESIENHKSICKFTRMESKKSI